jgi:nucleoside-diphosphate-sugar epimerase
LNREKIHKYFVKYGFPLSAVNCLFEKVLDKWFHIFGATGAIGLSFLYLIEHEIILPRGITIYVRKSSDFSRWESVCASQKIELKIVFNFQYQKITGNENVIFYFIGSAQPIVFLEDPIALFRLNVVSLIDLIAEKPNYLFYASSSELYTGIDVICDEDMLLRSNPQHIRSAYIESKRAGESILNSFADDSIKSVSFRVALATPPYNLKNDRRLLSDLIHMAKIDKKVSLKGGHQLRRQYQWGPFSVLKILYAGFFGKRNLYNISGGEELSLFEIAEITAKALGAVYTNSEQKINELNLGSPSVVRVSMNRFINEFQIDLKQEKFVDLIEMYISE